MKQKEIADLLGISTRQVRTHTNNGVLVRDEEGYYNAKENLARYIEFDKIANNYRGSRYNATEIFLKKFNKGNHEYKKTPHDLKSEISNSSRIRLDNFLKIYERVKNDKYGGSLLMADALILFIDLNASISNFSYASDSIMCSKVSKEVKESIFNEFLKSIASLQDEEVIQDTLFERADNPYNEHIIHKDDQKKLEKLFREATN